MIGPVRRRLTFANVTSVLALFVALGGVSYAAMTLPRNSVGTAQIKRDAVTGPKIKAGSVASSDLSRSVRGAITKVGARGAIGPKGDTGPKGDAGPAGPLLDTLPSGRTLRGVYAASGEAAAGGEIVRDAPSFALALPSERTAHVVAQNGPPTAQCPGDVDAPQAAAGHLCVYEGVTINAKLIVDGASSSGGALSADRFGWVAQISSVAAGAFQSRGTWAVTAP